MVRYHVGMTLQGWRVFYAFVCVVSGAVFEQDVRVCKTGCHSVLLRLYKLWADGDTENRLLLNLRTSTPSRVAG